MSCQLMAEKVLACVDKSVDLTLLDDADSTELGSQVPSPENTEDLKVGHGLAEWYIGEAFAECE
eukprot:6236788-Karenia_brevis.AAC.1